MPLSRRETPEDRPRDSVAGVVITERLVATSPGSASGTFKAFGAITATGTVLTGAWPWRACRSTTERCVVEGSERLVTAGGELRIDVRLSLRHISGTGVVTGGGSWNVRASELTNIAASDPGAKPISKRRTRFCGSLEPHE